MAAHVAHHRRHPPHAVAHQVARRRPGRRHEVHLAHGAEQRHRERHPPAGCNENRDAHRRLGGQQPGPRSEVDQRHRRHERHRRADVAPGIAGRRHAVHALRRGHVGQKRIVEHVGGRESDRGQPVHGQYRELAPGGHERQHRGGGHAKPEEAGEESLLAPLVVGHRTERGRQDGDHQRERAARERQPRRRNRARHIRRDHVLVEQREDGGGHHQRVRRVRHVVQYPGPFGAPS